MAEHARAKEISRIRIHLSPMRLCTCLCLSEARLLSHVTSQPLLESPPLGRKTRAQPVPGENSILIRLSLSLSLSSSFIDQIASRIPLNLEETHFSLFFSRIRFELFSILLEIARFTKIESTNFSPFFERFGKVFFRERYHASIVESIRISGFGR